jgi:hypothetical protein
MKEVRERGKCAVGAGCNGDISEHHIAHGRL